VPLVQLYGCLSWELVFLVPYKPLAHARDCFWAHSPRSRQQRAERLTVLAAHRSRSTLAHQFGQAGTAILIGLRQLLGAND